ncbi:MAG: hypothetical protein NTY35_05025 [Planctomycetota bacterium]|nr:hypothetical protein [Planctomycetota bacterium]
MGHRLRLVAIFLAGTGVSLLELACGMDVRAGYTGPYPSAAAQQALQTITGKAIVGSALGPPGAELTVQSFGVVPNPLTGKGPVVILLEHDRALLPHDPNAPQGADGRWYVPVLTDGDAADLVRRATGESPQNFGGATSEAYRKTLGLDER